MLTTLSKILVSVPNCNVRIDNISYENSSLGFAEVEGYVCDANGDQIFPISLPVAIHAVPDLVKSIHEEKGAPTPAKKLRSKV
jgi:hypothetical protein